jgi:hypothetical protein
MDASKPPEEKEASTHVLNPLSFGLFVFQSIKGNSKSCQAKVDDFV